MEIITNGKVKEVEEAITIQQLLAKGYVEMQEYVTVQVNEQIISPAEYASFVLNNGDVIEFLYYMGGGQNKP
jgi:sulfur carrier protein